MPLKLDTAIAVGALDDADYEEVRIIRNTHDSVRKFISMEIEYGRTVDGTWIPGATPKGKERSFHISGQAYTDLIAANAAMYVSIKDILYGWLNTNGDVDSGVVV